MQPRWFTSWLAENGYVYLGGTNNYDLWLDDSKDLRVVRADSPMDWDWVYWSQPRETYEWGTQDMETTGSPPLNYDEVLGEVLAYLRIFAPWVEEAMTTGIKDYHTT